MTATTVPIAAGPHVANKTRTRQIVRVGALIGAGMVYVAATGMLATFNHRLVIDPILSMGYLVLFGVPFVFGLGFSRRKKLEGVEVEPPSSADVVNAALAGLFGGLIPALFAFLVDVAPELRSTFPNWSPEMVDLLTLGLGPALGFVVLPLLTAVVSAAAAATRLLSATVRRALMAGGLSVLGFALFQAVIDDFFDWFDAIPDFLYTSARTLSVVAAIVVFALGAALAVFLPGRFKRPTDTGLRSEDAATRRRATLVYGGVIVGLIAILPLFLGGILNELLVNVGFFALMALGLNVVIGYAGLLDLGYVAFFAVGAYTMGVLTSPISPTWDPMLSWWVAFPIVLALAALAGLFVGTPVLRMRGDYLAIVTLGFGEIVRLLLLSDWLSPYFGGAQGIRNIPGIPFFGTHINVTTPVLMVYAVAIFVVLAAFISWRLEHSRVGRSWAAMREDEDVAEAVGVDTVKAKLTAFITGAVIASFAGALFAAKVGSVFS
ncbi:MAG: branched-chain amino acid ABC transporter permease, partial [Acidimicrobiia bacterium]